MKVTRDKHPSLFFSINEKKRVAEAIRDAEQLTSGEIRVHLASYSGNDARRRAEEVFVKLGMDKTDQRTGVLIFLDVKHHRFAVIGDIGINERVSDAFWDDIVRIMTEAFREDRFADGLVEAVRRIGEKLKNYFPHVRTDTNELPDEISYSF